MAYAMSGGGYSVDDLDWLRDELGIAHLELDPWGSLIVSPATDEHETAVAMLHENEGNKDDDNGDPDSPARATTIGRFPISPGRSLRTA